MWERSMHCYSLAEKWDAPAVRGPVFPLNPVLYPHYLPLLRLNRHYAHANNRLDLRSLRGLPEKLSGEHVLSQHEHASPESAYRWAIRSCRNCGVCRERATSRNSRAPQRRYAAESGRKHASGHYSCQCQLLGCRVAANDEMRGSALWSALQKLLPKVCPEGGLLQSPHGRRVLHEAASVTPLVSAFVS